MRRISMLAGLAAFAALSLQFSGVAQAAPSNQSVNAHVRQAIDALHDFQVAVRHGDDAAARRALHRNRHQTAVATRQAAVLNGSSSAPATRKVARLQARNLSSYVDMFSIAGSDLQLDLTNVISTAVGACGAAADAVEAAADYVPSAARDHVLAAAQAIRDACADAFPEGTDPADVTNQAIAACHDAIATFDALIGRLLSAVPANLPFASFIGDLTGQVTGVIHTVVNSADSACDMLGGIGTGNSTGMVGIFGSWLGGSNMSLPDISGILSGLFGGQSDSGPLGGIMGGQFGNLLGGLNFGNLIGGLFGGGGTGN